MPKPTKPRNAKATASEAKLKQSEPKTVTYTTEWTDPATGEIHTVRIKHTPKLFDHADFIEVEGEHQISVYQLTPHPLSDTGYLSIYVSPFQLKDDGGPVGYVNKRLAKALTSKEFRAASSKRAQGDLFAWAETRKAVTKRAATKKPRKPAAKPKPKAPKGRRPA